MLLVDVRFITLGVSLTTFEQCKISGLIRSDTFRWQINTDLNKRTNQAAFLCHFTISLLDEFNAYLLMLEVSIKNRKINVWFNHNWVQIKRYRINTVSFYTWDWKIFLTFEWKTINVSMCFDWYCFSIDCIITNDQKQFKGGLRLLVEILFVERLYRWIVTKFKVYKLYIEKRNITFSSCAMKINHSNFANVKEFMMPQFCKVSVDIMNEVYMMSPFGNESFDKKLYTGLKVMSSSFEL